MQLPIPIPISEPIIEIDSHLNLLTISKLNPSVSYEIQNQMISSMDGRLLKQLSRLKKRIY